MTKTVRIENADSGTDKKVVIEMFSNVDNSFVRSYELLHPTAQIEVAMHDGNYITVREETINVSKNDE